MRGRARVHRNPDTVQATMSARLLLDEARQISLGPESSFDETKAPLEDSERVIQDGVQAVLNQIGGLSLREGHELHDDQLLEFDTTSSSILSKLRGILDGLNHDSDEPEWDSSDPDVTKFLIDC